MILRAFIMYYIVALVAMGGARISFDHGWKFKYGGKGQPEVLDSWVSADSEELGNEASKAADGLVQTRWAAKDNKPGHYLLIKPKIKRKVHSVRIVWENETPKQIKVQLDYGKKKQTEELTTKGEETTIDIGGRTILSLKISVVGKGNWASIREVEFIDAKGKVITMPPLYRELTPGFVTKGWRKVQLPHDWAIESKFLPDEPNETGKLPWCGHGWYSREFNIPADFDAEAERYYLDFDGVMANPQVFVNGRKAGEWAYGYSSFRVDMTPYLRAGKKNVVMVLATNHPQSTRWYPGAGIYRHVWLEKTPPVHIDQWGICVTTSKIRDKSATVCVQTTICNTGNKTVDVKVLQQVEKSKAPPKRLRVQAGKSVTVEQYLELPAPRLWCCESPHLYELTTTLQMEDKDLDTRTTKFGVRDIEWRADGFYLNGKRVQIKGVCEHHDLGPLGAAFHERAYERKIETLKSMGCNAIRMTHNPPAPQALDLCDKHGMLVVDELFDIWKYQKYDKRNGYHLFWNSWWKRDVRQFMLRDRNHPCIIAWSGGNEVPEITRQDGVKISEALRDEIRIYDTTRPYTVGTNAANGAYNGFGDTQDVFGYNYKPSHYAGYTEKRPDKPFYGSETASCVGTRDTYVFPLRWGVNGGYVGDGSIPFQVSAYGLFAPGWGYCPDVEFTVQDAVPRVAGEFVWTGHDYLGEPTPYNQDASLENNIKHLPEKQRKAIMREYRKLGNKAPSRSSYFGIIDLAGFPKDTYYLYRSRWAADEKFAHLLPHWNWRGREGQVTPVMCFSSGDEAELFVNGRSQGVRRKGDGEHFSQAGVKVCKNAYRFVWENVKYQPGELKVVVTKNGKPWAEATRVTTGAATRVDAVADREEIVGDGRDLAYISMAVQDKSGHVVPTDCRKVSISVEGPAVLIGCCNGNPVDHTCMQSPKQEFFNGRMLAVVRAERKGKGVVKITVKPAGLPEKIITLHVKEASADELLR
ncbi:MAG: DUF4982 domain-containing protein [Akkermansiaceae bacterium]|nr:DUF4982 domain-containing protein [Akkermansiaceae bacterium]